jgi:hypothetical protein
MKNISNIAYGGITRNSLFEQSSNHGEEYSIDEVLSPIDLTFEIDDGIIEELPISIKDVYAVLKA